MTRVEFTRKQRVEMYTRCGGHCEGCFAKLKVGEGEYDHRIPLAMGGESVIENGQVLCRICHRQKTSTNDVPGIAKAKRIADKTSGAFKKKYKWPSRPFPKR